jgi:glucans biosynthesis protein
MTLVLSGFAGRRRLVRPLRALAIVLGLALLAPAGAFEFADVDRIAREQAGRPYARPSFVLPKALKDLSYDQVRDIRFEPTRSLWRAEKLPFEVQFFHLGGFFDRPVRVHEVLGREVREIGFDAADFSYGKNSLDRTQLGKLGFAGFRVHYALNTPAYKDELVVFLGASYFRALGKGQRYGASARGLAIDTAEREGEEFPRFEQFWIERPGTNASHLVIHALLNSRRVTGAYRFVIRPGAETVTEVHSRLYLREPVAKLGIAPLTSMFYFGENQRGPNDDFRPEVHDSDGLAVQTAHGEWIWRPLVNPRRLLVTSYSLTDPRGFGLLQRDREFSSYEDVESRYELRPSIWVEPISKWGSGRVELVQIPTPNETNDNIVAYWVPRVVPKVGEPYELSYRLRWQKGSERRPPTAWTVQTRRGHGHGVLADEVIQLTVDFDGPALRRLSDDAPVEADVWVGSGQRLSVIVHYNEATGAWRMVIQVRRQSKDRPVELRAQLQHRGQSVSETWSTILPPT